MEPNGNFHPAVPAANAFGAKFLREWTRTLKLIRPSAFLIAEEHEKRAWITTPTNVGGLGFDATWYVDVCHNLVGVPHDNWASLIARAGLGDDTSLNFDYLAGSMAWTGNRTITYHISHDEAGNSGSNEQDLDKRTHRTITQAVHGAPLIGATRDYAEARCRFAFGMAALSAGTPMFLMGEEIGSQQDYFYNNYFKEDFARERADTGARLFRFYQDIIRFRLNEPAVRSREIEVLYVHNDNRVIAFRRSSADEELIVFGTLNNRPFSSGYRIYNPRLADASWQEVFNSDATVYGGQNIGNSGGRILSHGGFAEPIIPANGFVVFRRI
jgi:1,4-alpha-glucan branching enzyme